MARYKPYDYGQMKLLPISFERQIPRGSFEFTLNRLIDEEIDLSVGTMKKGNASAHRGAQVLTVISETQPPSLPLTSNTE